MTSQERHSADDKGPQWTAAIKCSEAGDYVNALKIFQRLADQGYVEAFSEIGKIMELGEGGVETDYTSAATWYERAITAIDDADAHLHMGRLLLAVDWVMKMPIAL